MGAHDRAAAARAKMAQVQREMAERRALRDRNLTQKRAQSLEAFKKQGPVMAQVAKHMGELGRRRAQAGGWATEKTEQDKDFVMGFGFEDEEQSKDPYGYRPPQRPASTDTPPGGIGVIDDEAPPMPPPAPEAPSAPAPPAPPRPPRGPRRPERQELDDEDDFSNQSSWMQNR
ncbi:hypothetical protein [Actinophytocola glycyrrhizae]|uniref:Uncharacterized protein n=1 Tax=Actinophytocola glycyrrhizae TaxID=2044873 RepID=A0ABV9RXH9_9PSEU